jgi:hypothetical protein
VQTLLLSDPASAFYAEGVHRLRRLCRNTHLVPTSCLLPKEVTSLPTKPICQSNFSDVWRGQLDGADVALKVIRLHGDEVQEVKKVGDILVYGCLRKLTRQRPTSMNLSFGNAYGMSTLSHSLVFPDNMKSLW